MRPNLERFVRDWTALKTSDSVEVERFSGASDLGRDAVGFRTDGRHEGDRGNFQCKQYGRTLQTSEALLELGKNSPLRERGEFFLPTVCHFVVPRGIGREQQKLVFNPTQLKAELSSRWDAAYAKKISRVQTITMTPTLRGVVDAFDFTKGRRINRRDLLATAVCGWQMERQARAAGDDPFRRAKHVFARFYLEQILSEAFGLRAAATARSSLLSAIEADALMMWVGV